MKAELIDGYYFVTSDSNSLLGEKDEEIMRFSKEEFESFIDNFVLARALNNIIGVNGVKKAVLKALDEKEQQVKKLTQMGVLVKGATDDDFFIKYITDLK